MRLLSLLVASLALTAHAETKLFQYQLVDYPKSPAGCHAAAQEVGNKFVTTTGQGIKLARCVKEQTEGYVISVEYEAEAPAPLVTTKASHSIYPAGQYRTRDLCDADLATLSQTFQTQTGLAPAFAYCQKDVFSNSYPWFARLDAFGTTTKPPRVGGFLIFGIPMGYAPGAWGAEIAASLAQLGVVATHIRTHSGGGYATESVTYYHTDRLNFDSREVTKTYKKDECLNQVAAVKTDLNRFDVKPLSVYCGQDMLSEVQLTVIFPNTPDLRVAKSVETFPSFADCIAGKDALVQKYQVELKLPVLGGACTTGRGGVYHLALFEKR